VDEEEQRAHDLRELNVQVAQVKDRTAQVKDRTAQVKDRTAQVREKTRPWKEAIALVFAIAAAEASIHSETIFNGLMPRGWIYAVAYALAIVFFGLATVALFGISFKARAFFEPRVGSAHAAVIRCCSSTYSGSSDIQRFT